MRAVVQRVNRAAVTVEEKVCGKVGRGILVLVGIEQGDGAQDIAWLTGKIARLRIFNDDKGIMNLSLQDIGGEILIVSQFTLCASIKKGNRPYYGKAAEPETAIPLYTTFIQAMEKELGKPVATGEFGAYMQISLENDGPVTILMDSRNIE